MFTILTLYVNFLCLFLCFDKIYFFTVNYTYYVFRTKVKVFGFSNIQYTDARQRAIYCSSYCMSAIYVKKIIRSILLLPFYIETPRFSGKYSTSEI